MINHDHPVSPITDNNRQGLFSSLSSESTGVSLMQKPLPNQMLYICPPQVMGGVHLSSDTT
jgi:hypothetical protein